MNDYLTGLAACLHVLFTTTASALGKATAFLQRRRCSRAADFAQTLVSQGMACPNATLESLAGALDLSPQALHQRLGPAALAFWHALLVQALRAARQAASQRLGLLDRFRAVGVADTTVIALPAALAEDSPGGGGGSGAGQGAAALQVLLRWDVRSGAVLALSVHAGRTCDQELAATAADLPEGALHRADPGFFNSQRWAALSPRQYGIRRVRARTLVRRHGGWQALTTLRAGVPPDVFDEAVHLVQQAAVPCRRVAWRGPAAVAARRRPKLRQYTRHKQGREPSAAQLLLCAWRVFATNVAAAQLSAVEVWLVYRCRWPVELLFKRAKQLAGWGRSRGRSGARVLVEWYAKLLGLRVLPWGSLLRGGRRNGIRPWKRLRVVQDLARLLREGLGQGVAAVCQALARLGRRLARIRPQPNSRKRPSTRQLLLHPTRAC